MIFDVRGASSQVLAISDVLGSFLKFLRVSCGIFDAKGNKSFKLN